MKILFVCQQYIHAARWISQLKDSEHEIFVFDCLDREIHEGLKWTNYTTNWNKRKLPYIKGEYYLEKNLPNVYSFMEPFLKVTASEKLEELILEIKPDLVHSLEMQTQTYPLHKTFQKIEFNWAYFSWGSDMFLFGKEKSHAKKIRAILPKIDYLFTDNTRDVSIANKFGYQGHEAFVLPGGGGYEIERYLKYYKPIKERKLILVKGYHHWAGRALVVLKALELLKEQIKDYSIYVYSAHDCVVEKIKEMQTSFEIEYSSRQNEISHEELLQKFGNAKIAIGNSISDGIPNTLLEAMLSGAFPIQSNPGGVSQDYIEDNRNGCLIHDPEDAQEISKIILKVMNNDKLMESAAAINLNKSQDIGADRIRNNTLEIYDNISKNL